MCANVKEGNMAQTVVASNHGGVMTTVAVMLDLWPEASVTVNVTSCVDRGLKLVVTTDPAAMTVPSFHE